MVGTLAGMFLGKASEGKDGPQERDGTLLTEPDCRRLALYLTPIRALSPEVYTFDLTFADPNRSVTAPTFKDMPHVLLTVTAT